MENTGKFLSVIVIFLLCVVAVIMVHAESTKYSDADYFEDKYLQNVEVKSARIESPSVVIDVDRTEFLELLGNNSLTTVYRQSNVFYHFNEDMTIAYALEIPMRFFWVGRGW